MMTGHVTLTSAPTNAAPPKPQPSTIPAIGLQTHRHSITRLNAQEETLTLPPAHPGTARLTAALELCALIPDGVLLLPALDSPTAYAFAVLPLFQFLSSYSLSLSA